MGVGAARPVRHTRLWPHDALFHIVRSKHHLAAALRLPAGQPLAVAGHHGGAVHRHRAAVQTAARRHRQALVRQEQGPGRRPLHDGPAALAAHRAAFYERDGWRQWWQILRFDAVGVFRSVPFMVMLLFGVINLIAGSSVAKDMYGTAVYPMTHLMLQNISNSFSFMLIIIVAFYAGELIFKERQVKIADVSDAMPVPNWVPLLAKCTALIGVIAGYLLVGVIAAIGFQLFKGGAPVELALYLKGTLLGAFFFVLMALCALTLQVLSNNKFIGYLLVIVLMIVQGVLGMLHFEHNLYNFAARSEEH